MYSQEDITVRLLLTLYFYAQPKGSHLLTDKKTCSHEKLTVPALEVLIRGELIGSFNSLGSHHMRSFFESSLFVDAISVFMIYFICSQFFWGAGLKS